MIQEIIRIFRNQALRQDFLCVLLMAIICIPTVLFFHVRYFTSTLLFFGVPAVYLFIRKPIQPKKLIAALCGAMMLLFIVDFLAEINGAWSWAPTGQLIFINKIFGLIPIDVLIWYFFWVLFSIIFYEHFFEVERPDKVSPLFKYFIVFFSGVIVLLISIFYINPHLLLFPYAYFFIGLFGSLPFFYLIFIKPSLVKHLLQASVFNLFLYLSFELTALYLDQWRFPGQYIGHVKLFNQVFPVEELVFWILLGTPIMLAYYKIFIDLEIKSGEPIHKSELRKYFYTE